MGAQDKRSKEAEEIAEKWIRTRGFVPKRFSKQEKKNSKTPDFSVFKGKELLFFCEVKSSRDDFLNDLLNNAEPGEIVGGARNDPTHNRISNDINKASKQFLAVNPGHDHPNVLASVNYDRNSDFMDIINVASGNFIDDEGRHHPIYKKYSEGRTKEALEIIDLIVWFNGVSTQEKYFFTMKNINQHQHICEILGVDPDLIKIL